MYTKRIIAFILSAKKFNFNVKLMLREIMLYAFSRFPYVYNNIPTLRYAHENGFIREDPWKNLKRSIYHENVEAIKYWIEKGADPYRKSYLFLNAIIAGGDLLRFAIKIDKSRVIELAKENPKSFEHIDIFLEEYGNETHPLIFKIIHSGNQKAFNRLHEVYDKEKLFDLVLRDFNWIFCKQMLKAGFNVCQEEKQLFCWHDYFWTDIVKSENFDLADLLLEYKFKPQKFTMNLMSENLNKIFRILNYCCECELPLKITREKPKKIEKMRSRIIGHKDEKLLSYFELALSKN